MINSTYFIMAFITLILSIAVMLLTLTRLNCSECKRSRLKYTVVFIAALAAGLQPYFLRDWPGISNVLVVVSLLWLLWDGNASVKAHAKLHQHEDMENVKDIDIVIDRAQ